MPIVQLWYGSEMLSNNSQTPQQPFDESVINSSPNKFALCAKNNIFGLALRVPAWDPPLQQQHCDDVRWIVGGLSQPIHPRVRAACVGRDCGFSRPFRHRPHSMCERRFCFRFGLCIINFPNPSQLAVCVLFSYFRWLILNPDICTYRYNGIMQQLERIPPHLMCWIFWALNSHTSAFCVDFSVSDCLDTMRRLNGGSQRVALLEVHCLFIAAQMSFQ